MELSDVGRWLIGAAIVLAVVGALFLAASALGVGRLPGDFSFGGERFRVYLPLATSLILSIVATVLLNLFFRR